MEDQSVLHYLVRIGVMDDGHVSGGMTYLDWKHAYYSETGAKITRLDDKAGTSSREDKASKYLLITRRLGNDRAKIETALEIRPVGKEHQRAAHLMRNDYLSAFDRLGSLIREVNEIANNTCANVEFDLA